MKIDLFEAKERLLKGDVVAIPTETVYGLAASIHQPHAIQKIFLLKGRPQDNPLIVHIASVNQALDLMLSIPEDFHELAERFWPGPLTLVVPAKIDRVPNVVRASLPTVALRFPSHPLAQELLKLTGPLVAPSANLSGRPSSTLPHHVEQDFGSSFPVLDGGASSSGLESTILIEKNGWVMGRKGAIPQEELMDWLIEDSATVSSRPLCPGQYYRHYSPLAKLTTSSTYDGTPPVVLGFIERSYPGANEVIELGSLNHPEQIGASLYDKLRLLDRRNIPAAWVDLNFPKEGLLATIAERLYKSCQEC